MRIFLKSAKPYLCFRHVWEDARKTPLPMDRAVLDSRAENGKFMLDTLAGEILTQKVNGFRLKPYAGPTPPNPFRSTAVRHADPLPLESSLNE